MFLKSGWEHSLEKMRLHLKSVNNIVCPHPCPNFTLKCSFANNYYFLATNIWKFKLLSFVTAEMSLSDFILDTLSLLEFSKCSWKAVPSQLLKQQQQQPLVVKWQLMRAMLIKQTLGLKEIRHCLHHCWERDT